MLKTITTGWNFFRILRFVTGMAVLVQSLILQEWLLAFAGIFLAGMAVFTKGCGVNGCDNNLPSFKNKSEFKEIIYEELDPKK
jgi:hypothetical protein